MLQYKISYDIRRGDKMKFTTGVLAASTAMRRSELKKILRYIKNHNEEQGKLALKEFKRFNIITILIILLVMLPLFFYTLISFANSIDNPKYPPGATKEVRGHISLYEETFWYTDSSQKYEFSLADYNINDSYEPGEIVKIYLDNNNNVISVAPKTEDKGLFISIILMFALPIILLIVHSLIGRKTYAKNWYLYVRWYKQEIEPYIYQENFEEIVADKKYYDVVLDIKTLSLENQKRYKKYQIKNVIYSLLLLCCIIATIYFCNKFHLNPYSWFVIEIITIYVIIFYILIDSCDIEMHRIKTGYYDNKEKTK